MIGPVAALLAAAPTQGDFKMKGNGSRLTRFPHTRNSGFDNFPQFFTGKVDTLAQHS